MTDIEMSITIGAVFVAGVIVYNKWQEHKAKKSVERAFSSDHDDVLMRVPDVRQEPSFDLGAAGSAPADDFEPIAAVPPVNEEGLTPAAEHGHQPGRSADRLPDPARARDRGTRRQTDPPVAANPASRRQQADPLHRPAVSGDWEPVTHGGVYTKLQAGVQMASRSTALNELEYSELVTRLRTLADEIGAEPEIPDMIEVMGEARICTASSRATTPSWA
jgi:hypothetical protein